MSDLTTIKLMLALGEFANRVSEEEMKQNGYNGKIIVTKVHEREDMLIPFTIGKTYEFVNGKCVDDIGIKEPLIPYCKNIEDIKTFLGDYFDFKVADEPEKLLNCRFVVIRSSEEDLPVGTLVTVNDGRFKDATGSLFPCYEEDALRDEEELAYYLSTREFRDGHRHPRIKCGYTTYGIGHKIIRGEC